MNKKVVLPILVGVVGAAASISAAAALYVKADGAKTINVSLTTSADATLSIGDIKKSSSGTETHLSPGNSETYTWTLGASKATASTYTQKIIMGDLTVKISSDNATLLNNISATNSLSGAQDTANWSGTASPSMTLAKDSDTNPTCLTATIKNLAVYVDGQTTCSLAVSLTDGIDDSSLVQLGGASYTVSVSFTDKVQFDYAYVLGTMNGWTDKQDAYQMVPNIAASAFEWMWCAPSGYKTVSNAEVKCKVGDTWSANNVSIASLEAGGGIFWNGQSSSDCTYSAPQGA